MAPFNPDLPKTNDPSYLRLSKPIDQPEADKTTATVISGLANVFDSAVKSADFITKTKIDDVAENAVDTEKEGFTKFLENPQTEAMSRSAGLTGAPLQTAPRTIQDGMAGIETLTAANAAGKISPTYYYGRLNSVLKSLRAEYPGYRDYIDKKVSSLVGTDPANAYMANLMRDLNTKAAAVPGSADYLKKGIEFALSHQDDMPEGGKMARDLINAPTMENLNAYLKARSDWKLPEIQFNRIKTIRENNLGGMAYDAKTAEHDANGWIPTLVNSRMSSMSNAANMPHSFIELNNLINNSLQGHIAIDETQANQYSQMVNAWKNRTRDEIDAYGRRAGWVQAMGPEAWNKMVENHLVNYDHLARALTDKDIPLAASHMAAIRAATNETAFGLMSQPGVVGATIRNTAAAKLVGGDNAVALITKDSMNMGFTSGMATYYRNEVSKMVVQPDYRYSGKLYTMSDAVRSAANPPGGAPPVTDPKYYQGVVNANDIIADPKVKDEAKVNMAAASYSPQNKDFISLFPKDSVDQRGVLRPGKAKVFSQMTTPDKTAEIWRLAHQNKSDPLWQNYRDWAGENFGLQIFTQELKDLSGVMNNPNVTVTWDTENHNWTVRQKPYVLDPKVTSGLLSVPTMASSKTAQDMAFKAADQSVQRINRGLSNMANIAKQEGTNIDAYLLRLLTESGVDVSKGIPRQMFMTLVGGSQKASQSPSGARTGDKTNPPRVDALQFADEPNRGRSVQDFLRNPAGQTTGGRGTPYIRPDPLAIGGDITGMEVTQVPPGVDPADVLRNLQRR